MSEWWTTDCIDPFWDDEYKALAYVAEPFNSPADMERWRLRGYCQEHFAGEMCDMRHEQTSWNHKVIDHFTDKGWYDVCTTYYRMHTGMILPEHRDRYVRYKELYNLEGKEHQIRRALIFLEDWQDGHYFSVTGKPIMNYNAGEYVMWENDVSHMAANIGKATRYTLQITGQVK